MIGSVATAIVIIIVIVGAFFLNPKGDNGDDLNSTRGVGGGSWAPKAGDFVFYFVYRQNVQWYVNLTIISVTSTEMTISSVRTDADQGNPTQTQVTVPINHTFGTGIPAIGFNSISFVDPSYLPSGYSIVSGYGGSGQVNTGLGQIACEYHSLEYSGDDGSWSMNLYVHNGVLIKGAMWVDVIIWDTNVQEIL